MEGQKESQGLNESTTGKDGIGSEQEGAGGGCIVQWRIKYGLGEEY